MMLRMSVKSSKAIALSPPRIPAEVGRAPRVATMLTFCFILMGARSAIAQGGRLEDPDKEGRTLAGVYRIDDIGPLATIAADVTVSLNDDGAVAYWTKTNGAVHAALWRDGRTIVIENPPGYQNSIAHAINRSGDVAGWMNTSGNLVDSSSNTRGFVRRGEHIEIVAGPGGRDCRIFSLNEKHVAAGAAMTADGSRHAFLFSRSVATDLGTLPSGKSSTAYAINNRGVAAGVADLNGKFNHAVSWSMGKIKDLGTLDHGTTSSARAINDSGQIAGFSDTPDGVHPFLYTRGKMRDLGTLGKDPSEASGLNNRGEVVGASNLTGAKRHAFLWRDGKILDLNNLLPLGSKWVLRNAFSINDRGQIACAASSTNQGLHLLLLTPQKNAATHDKPR